MGKPRRDYKVWCAFDTETCNVIAEGAEPYAVPILYIFNDLHNCDMSTYEIDCPAERVTFYRHEEEAIRRFDDMVQEGIRYNCIPVVCVYNMIFDLQTILYRLNDTYDMRANAQSSTNVYTLDLLIDDVVVLRVWDTYHLEMRGLSAIAAINIASTLSNLFKGNGRQYGACDRLYLCDDPDLRPRLLAWLAKGRGAHYKVYDAGTVCADRWSCDLLLHAFRRGRGT